MDHRITTVRVWTADGIIAQNTWLYQVLVKLRFNDDQTADGQGYLYIQTSCNEPKNKNRLKHLADEGRGDKPVERRPFYCKTMFMVLVLSVITEE